MYSNTNMPYSKEYFICRVISLIIVLSIVMPVMIVLYIYNAIIYLYKNRSRGDAK